MKKMISLILVVLIIGFLAVTNPTVDEYARWYTDRSFPDRDGAMDDLLARFTEHMATSATRTDYLVCSVYTYDDHKVLGIALMFFPIDDAIAQVEDFRADYADWLAEMTTQP